MIALTLQRRSRVIQISVNYLPRVGVSAVTGYPVKAFQLGLRMIWLITLSRLLGGRRQQVVSDDERRSAA